MFFVVSKDHRSIDLSRSKLADNGICENYKNIDKSTL